MGSRGPLPFTSRPGSNAGATNERSEPMPDAPEHLSAAAKEEYRRIVALNPHLTASDSTTLADHAQAVAEIAECNRVLAKDGMIITATGGNRYIHPQHAARASAHKLRLATAIQLGLTPAARARNGQPGANANPASQPTTGPAAFAAAHGSDAA